MHLVGVLDLRSQRMLAGSRAGTRRSQDQIFLRRPLTTFGSDFAHAESRFSEARCDARLRSTSEALSVGIRAKRSSLAALTIRAPERRANACLYCRHGFRKRPPLRPRRRAAPPPRRARRHSRRVEADLVAHIGEVDERRLYAREASPSMFAYCTERLHLSEAEAYRRITVARAARKHAVLLAMLRDGRLHLTGIAMLAPLLTRDNRDAVLARATHRSKRQIEELVAELSPRPDVPAVMRKLPDLRKTRRQERHRARTRPRGAGTRSGQSHGSSRTRPGQSLAAPRLARPRARAARRAATAVRSSSRCRRPATRCSSPPAPSSTTSSSGSPP